MSLTANNLIVMPEPKAEKKLVRLRGERVFFSGPELRAFFAAAEKFGPREHALFAVGFSHGMRVSELSDLRLSDLRFQSGQIQIRRLKGSRGTLQHFVVLDNFNERAILEKYLAVRPNVDSDRVFVSRQRNGVNPHAIHRSQLYRLFRSICLAAGLNDLSKFGPHILKHTC